MDVLLYATANPRNLGSIVRTSVVLGLDKVYLYDEHNLLNDYESMEQMSVVCRRNRQNKLGIISIMDPIAFIDSYSEKYATLLSPKSKRLGSLEDNFKFSEEGLIIFGCEEYGLPRKITRMDGVQKFVIPTIDPVECLGLAEAYAIIMFEYLRQYPNNLPKYK